LSSILEKIKTLVINKWIRYGEKFSMKSKNISTKKENGPNYGLKIPIFVGLVFLLLAFANLAVFAQHSPENCPLDSSNRSGDLNNFIVEGSGTTSLSVSLYDFGGDWAPAGYQVLDGSVQPGPAYVDGSVVIVSPDNAVIAVSPIPTGKGTISISASKTDPTKDASFKVKFVTTFGHYIIIDVILTCPNVGVGCTLTQGYWKNHPEVWPVDNLTLGSVPYTKEQLLTIFGTPVRGNGLISLSHQLIAAKLNASKVPITIPSTVTTAITAADAQIGARVVPTIGNGFLSTSSTRSLTALLDTFNNGLALDGPPHCE
jgi:hypothetical protein